MLHPQAFGDLSVGFGAGKRTCALGAAKAAGYDTRGLLEVAMMAHDLTRCPACHVYAGWVSLVVHLNDQHRWTRERIADWVATVEPPEPVVLAHRDEVEVSDARSSR
jgi:hypothetical protein